MAIPDWALKKDVRRSNNTREISGSFPPGGAQVVAGAAPSETSRRSRKERSDRHRRGERSTRRRRRREESSPDGLSRSEKTRRDEGSGIPRGLAPRDGRPREKSRNPEEFKPSGADAKRIRLGKTSGVLAAGAWAAREEIAKLIEEGHRSPDILRAIRDAREDSPELGQQPKFLPVEKGRASKDSSGTPREGSSCKGLQQPPPGVNCSTPRVSEGSGKQLFRLDGRNLLITGRVKKLQNLLVIAPHLQIQRKKEKMISFMSQSWPPLGMTWTVLERRRQDPSR